MFRPTILARDRGGLMMTRREILIALGVGACNFSFSTFTYAQKIQRIGILFGNVKTHPNLLAFRRELQRLGYIEGQNIIVVNRIADGHIDRFPTLAAELVAEKVDVIFAHSTNAVEAARQVTTSIPIVFASVSDPVGSGFEIGRAHV